MNDTITLLEIVGVVGVILVPIFVFLEREDKPMTYEEQKKAYREKYGVKEKKPRQHFCSKCQAFYSDGDVHLHL